MTTRAQFIAKMGQIQTQRKLLRQKARNLKTRDQHLNSFPLVADTDSIRANLEKILPKSYLPKNIGKYSEAKWDFYIPFNFDFGVDPAYDINSKLVEIQKITQESSFLLFGMSRNAEDPLDSGLYAPLAIEIKDLQSSRQFNDTPVPTQFFGERGIATYFDTPLFFSKNARIQITMNSWLAPGEIMPTVGSGKHEIVLFGQRIRNDDANEVLTSIFG